ncbi:MAG: energy-coupling factor transporter transmembrane component T family protein [Dethiobacteria bacterium]|nr:energy-coupling factor transporter transmembrane protein EcfT [Bacillota bacterium]MDW7728411.1 energy-coupling factor transporter transmembrane component T [Bacillota bacterium]
MELTKNITLGVYLPGETVIHRLDPRTKIVIASLLIFLLLMIKSYPAYGMILLFLTAVIFISGIPIRYALCGLKPMLPVLILMWFFQLFLYSSPDAHVIFSWWIFTATDAGMHMGNLISLRVFFLFGATTILTLTTSMVGLTDGMESLLNPLRKIGLPTQELVMTMVIALRFVLILAEELDKIVKAQMARGVAFDRGNFIQKTKKLFPVFLPLFINAFKRAEELIVAMESRSYTGGKGRTKMKTLHMGRVDLIAGLIMLIFSAIVILIIFTIQPQI